MSGTIVTNDSYEILTPTGWKNFLGIKRDIKITLVVRFTDGFKFSCTPDHEIYINKQTKVVGTLLPGDIVYGKRVVDVKLSTEEYVYDPIDVADGHTYYSEGIVNHNCTFLGSSLTLISADTFSKMIPLNYIYSKDGLDVIEAPVKPEFDDQGKITSKGNTYVIIADTAKGVGGDYSAFTVIDITEVPYKQVAKYRNNKISPLLYPNVIHKVAKEYNDAYVLIETNSSEQVPYILHDELEYDNILYVNRSTKGQFVSAGFGGGQTQLGVQTDKRVKRIGCQSLKSLVEEQKLLIHDVDTIAEISTFIEVRGSYEADDGYHDDLVMTLVLFAWLTTCPYFKDLNNVNLRHIMYKNQMELIESELTPVGWFNDGSTQEAPMLNF